MWICEEWMIWKTRLVKVLMNSKFYNSGAYALLIMSLLRSFTQVHHYEKPRFVNYWLIKLIILNLNWFARAWHRFWGWKGILSHFFIVINWLNLCHFHNVIVFLILVQQHHNFSYPWAWFPTPMKTRWVLPRVCLRHGMNQKKLNAFQLCWSWNERFM
jgi:hypothetical protein